MFITVLNLVSTVGIAVGAVVALVFVGLMLKLEHTKQKNEG